MRKISFLLIMILFTSLISYSQSNWYVLFEGEKYVTDFTLKAQSSKTVTIESDKPIRVGYRINTSPGFFEKYGSDCPVCMEDRYTGDSMCSAYADMEMLPHNGKIELLFTNQTKEDFQILVYIKEVK